MLPHARRFGLLDESKQDPAEEVLTEQLAGQDAPISSPASPPPPLPPQMHIPKNPSVTGDYFADSRLGELHDTFRGHTARQTRREYKIAKVCSAVIAANATSFLQWNDKHFHKVRHLLASVSFIFFEIDDISFCVSSEIPAATQRQTF